MFDQKTISALGYYVYMLIDPRNDQPFYVGKGQGNRVFQHVIDAKTRKSIFLIKIKRKICTKA